MNFQDLIYPITLTGIGSTLLCGFLVGLDRQLSQKPVGIRTCCLISLGTYTFVRIGFILLHTGGDHARIIGQIITGIGFLGAGVILIRGEIILGITSAAVIWTLAGIGILNAMEKYTAAIFVSLFVILILRGVTLLERFFLALRKGIYSRLTKHRDEET